MKKLYVSAGLAAISLSVLASSKLDGPSQIVADTYMTLRQNPASKAVVAHELESMFVLTARGSINAAAFVTLAPGKTAADVERFGVYVIDESNNILLVEGDMDALLELAESDAITLLSFSEKNDPMLDAARTSIGADAIHKGTDLDMPRKGSGVICGIYDSGIDINHINFMNADLSASRVKALYHFNGTSGGYIEYSTPERISIFTTDKRSGSHGTHTLGCMAGSFNGRQNTAKGITGKYSFLSTPDAKVSSTTANRNCPYYGMAPEADIVAGAGELYDANITGAVGRIAKYAHDAGQPAVINLSIGSVLGPRDGSDSRGQFLSGKTSDAIILVSAGNDGDNANSLTKTFATGDTQLKSFIGTGSGVSGTIDIWAVDSRKFTFSPVIVDRTTGEIAYRYDCSTVTPSTITISTNNFTASGYIKDAAMDQAFTNSYFQFTTSENTKTNNRYSCRLSYQFNYNATTNANGNLVPGFIIEGVAGQRVDVANNSKTATLSARGLSGWSDGDGSMSINNMACAKGIIAVGAYTTRKRWATMGSSVYSYTHESYIEDHICRFSSHGVTADGRSLPHVAAPGAAIISSYSRYYAESAGLQPKDYSALYTWNNRDHYWAADQGTSMSCPITAGIVALWLQADPTLTPDDIIETFRKTSTRPAESLGDNDIAWGSGKVEAIEGLKYVLNRNSVADITADANMPVVTFRDNTYNIFVPGAEKVATTIYDLSGQAVKKDAATGNTIDVATSELNAGIYILTIDGSDFARRIAVK